MSASFIVRAQVMDASVKEAFDRWYEDEHLPDAVKAFGARRAWPRQAGADRAALKRT